MRRPGRTGGEPPAARPGDAVGAASLFAVLEMNDFVLRHLARLYRALDGDLLLAMVLGEVAHHNVGRRLPRSVGFDVRELGRVLDEHGREALLSPCNAYSISASTGIPYETVRRKVAALVRRGWLVRDTARNLFVTTKARLDLGEVTAASVDDFVHTARSVVAGPVAD